MGTVHFRVQPIPYVDAVRLHDVNLVYRISQVASPNMSLLGTRPTTRCTECMRSFAYGYLKEARAALGSIEHVRGKKRSTRGPLTIPVRLLRDMPAYGPAGGCRNNAYQECHADNVSGAVVPVTAGQMRNDWLPSRKADYLLEPERRALKRSKAAIERDYQFGRAEDVEEAVLEKAEEQVTRLEVRGITPERSMELVEIFVPKRFDFYRQVIETDTGPVTPTAPVPRGRDAASELMALRAEQALKVKQEAERNRPKAIYGSVSTADVLIAVKAAMGTNEEASRVVLEERNISFVASADLEDATKLKTIGTFDYLVTIRGTNFSVARTVRIVPQDAAGASAANEVESK